MAEPDDDPLAFERQKWEDERALRERELALRERELTKSSWRSPLMVAVSAATLAAIGNLSISYVEGRNARLREWDRADHQYMLELQRADSARILKMIESDDPAAIRNNLKFLLEAGLIQDPSLNDQLSAYLRDTPDSQIPRLPQSSDAAQTSIRRLEVLAFGVAQYAQENLRLANTVKDAEALAEAVGSQRGGFYSEVNVALGRDPDKATMVQHLQDLATRTDPGRGDVALIYFAGHAYQLDGEFYLVPADADVDPIEDLGPTSLAVEELARLLRPLAQTSHVILAIDACPMSQHESLAASLGFPTMTVVLAAEPGGICFDGITNSPFAMALAEAFTFTADSDADGAISVFEFVEHIRTRTREMTDDQQIPWASVGSNGILLKAVAPSAIPMLETAIAMGSQDFTTMPPDASPPVAVWKDGWSDDYDAAVDPEALPAPTE